MIFVRFLFNGIENRIFYFQIKTDDLIMLSEMLCFANVILNIERLDFVQHAYEMHYLTTIFDHNNV